MPIIESKHKEQTKAQFGKVRQRTDSIMSVKKNEEGAETTGRGKE